MSELLTVAEFDLYAASPRRYIVIRDTTRTHVHKVSCRHVRRAWFDGTNRNRTGGYFTVASVREAFEQFGAEGCSDRICTTQWDIAHLKQQAS